MFIWNMLGALILIPALAYFLLPPSAFQRHALSSGKAVGGTADRAARHRAGA
jgi:hypothetical protein